MKKVWDKLKKNKYFKIILVLLVLLFVGWMIYVLFIEKNLQFRKNEETFLAGVKNYYEYNTGKLPREGSYTELSLAEMSQKSWVESLYVPGAKRMCDGDSFVRVIHENGEYRYITYLKCGKFESNVDHTAPTITLNGEDTVVISLNNPYQDAGVKEVKDDRDKIDVKDVQVDTSKVNTSQVGTYEVTYKVYDKTYNSATLKRTVVVAETFGGQLLKTKGASYVYSGAASDNYVLFSGMMWRIVKLDGEGNIALISENNLANTFYSLSTEAYPESNIYKWLNEYFYSQLNEKSKTYILDNKWCYDNRGSLDAPETCDASVTAKVGLLSLGDYQRSFFEGRSFLVNASKFCMLNKQDERSLWMTNVYEDGKILSQSASTLAGIRPVIYIKKDIYQTGGSGTSANPYKLQDYSYAKENELLNTRVIGEYINYSGSIFRVAGTDKDGNTKLVAVNYLKSENSDDNFLVSYASSQENVSPNIGQEGNIYYTLNHEALDYISEKFLITHEYEVPIYDGSKNVSDYQKKKITSKIGLPASYELFSSYNNLSSTSGTYWLSEYTEDGTVSILNENNSLAFRIGFDSFPSAGIKPVIYVDKGLKIASGKGSASDPYYVR